MRGWAQRLWALAVVLLAGTLVGLAAAGGWLYWNRVELRSEQTTRAELAPLAAQDIPKILGYDYQTVEAGMTEVYPLLTPTYRREFEDQAAKQIIPQARERQVISQVNVVGVGVLAAHRMSGSVLVFLNRTITDKSKQPYYDGSRVQVNYQKVDRKWLIDAIKPI